MIVLMLLAVEPTTLLLQKPLHTAELHRLPFLGTLTHMRFEVVKRFLEIDKNFRCIYKIGSTRSEHGAID